jgi:hypothetical protein
MDHFMLDVIKNDFGVSLLKYDSDHALFAAFRKGGTERIRTNIGLWESNIVGVWHFVEHVQTNNQTPIKRFEIKQVHVPRYRMAKAAELLRSGGGDAAEGDERFLAIAKDLQLRITMNGQWAVFGPWSHSILLPKNLTDKLEEDIGLLLLARNKVKLADERFEYRGILTDAGNRIFHSSQQLVEAIAFEKAMLPRLKPHHFGIYSAFCTYKDFFESEKMPLELINNLVVSQCKHDPNKIEERVMDIFIETQNRFLSRPIWGRNINISESEATEVLALGFQQLAIEKLVQFVLMNGMHDSGLFLPLAALTATITFDNYAELVTQGFQPDSGHEQDRRKETAYIALYGELAIAKLQPLM